MIERLARDLRVGARSLRRTPILTIAAAVSITLGVGAATAVYSIVDAALFRPPPLDHPEQLAALYMTQQAPSKPVELQRWSWRRARLISRLTTSFESVATFTVSVVAITGEDAEPVSLEVVSHEYFATLRVAPALGRGFDATEDDSGSPLIVLGGDLWQRRFGGRPDVIGRTLELNGVRGTIIGVMPAGFSGLSGRAQAWVTPTFSSRATYADYLTTNQSFISVIARVRPGVSIDQARRELEVVGNRIQTAAPAVVESPGTVVSATAVSLNDARIDPSTKRPMLLLLAAAACLLALACANVAGLLLGRAATRVREIGIRIATGATRGRIVAQLLSESAILAAVSGTAGILLAVPLVNAAQLPRAMWRGRNFYGALSEFSSPSIDARVVSLAALVCVVTTLVFGLVPAFQATKLDVTAALRTGAGGATGRTRTGLRRIVVGVETALAVILLFGGALFAASWHRLATTDTGFDRSHLLTFLIRPSEVAYPPPKAEQLIERLLSSLEALPGVDAASVDGCTPVGTGCANSTLFIVGRPEPPRDQAPPVLRHYVGPHHFQTLNVPVLRGRPFDARDRAGSPRVAIINQLAAERFWPNEDPIGKRVWFGGGSSFDRPDSSAEIVGIVGNVAYQTLDERPFQPDFYTPAAQFTYASRTVLVRSRLDPGALIPEIRRALRTIDPSLAMFEVRSMDDVMSASWARVSYQTKIVAGFAVIAMLLAGTGIFAIVAHVVGARRREIGVRVALGASAARVMTTVADSGARPAVLGLVIGLTVALALERVLASAIYGVKAFEPSILASVPSVLLAVIAAASWLAARRALRVDPAEALRAE